MHQTKTFAFDGLKSISETGTFEGLLSPYGNVDGGGDVVEPGAYTKTLKDNGAKVPMLWQHQTDMPIGDMTLDDRTDGLWCKGRLLLELPGAQTAYACIKAGIVRGLSIGFQTMRDQIENGVRHLKEIRLYEGSIVTFPQNELAVVTSVKQADSNKAILAALADFKAEIGGSLEKKDFTEELTEIQTLSGFNQMLTALEQALRQTVWSSDMTPGEKIRTADTIVQQFGAAFSEFFPAYVATLTENYGPVETWASHRKLQTKTATTAREIRQNLAGQMLKVARVNLTRKEK